MNSMKATYQACDDSGMPFEQGAGSYRRPAWQKTSTPFQVMLLNVVSLKYFPSRDIHTAVIQIEKGTKEIKEGVCRYPSEWIQEKIQWVTDSRHNGNPIGIKGLVTAITNTSALQGWKEKRGLTQVQRTYTLDPKILREIEAHGTNLEEDNTDALT